MTSTANVDIENASVTSDKFVSGILIGFLRPLANVENTAVENCHVKSSSSQIKSRDTAAANGGIVGCLNFTAGSASTAVIRNCYAKGIRLLNDQGEEGGQPAVLEYSDPENRTATWQIKQKDIFLCGAISYL